MTSSRRNNSIGTLVLKILAVVIWAAGLAVYIIGFHNADPSENILTTILRSALSAAEMFVGHSSLGEISLEAHANAATHWHPKGFYLFCFILIHVSAVVITIIVALRTLMRRVWRFITLFCQAHMGKKKSLHVFFSTNKASVLMAKDIMGCSALSPLSAKEKARRQEENRVIFVSLPHTEQREKGESTFSTLIGLFSYNRHVLDSISEVGKGTLLIRANQGFSSFKAADKRTDDPLVMGDGKAKGDIKQQFLNPNHFVRPFDLFRRMGLRLLTELITKRSTDVRLYLLSENEQRNVQALDVISSDPFFYPECSEKSMHMSIYCQAQQDDLNMFEEIRLLEKTNIEVHVLNASSLSVLYLQRQPECLPVNYVDIEQGRVTSEFRAMVIGFGETGQTLLPFLYEHSTFLGRGNERSPYHITAIDSHMDELRGSFLMQHPGLTDNPNLELEQVEIGSKEFWTLMKREIGKLNYVTIALGDDHKNMSLAVALYKFAMRLRDNNLSRFTIYVRSYEHDNECHMNSVAQHYNRFNHAQRQKGEIGNIVIFGELDEIYCCNLMHMRDEVRREQKTQNASQMGNAIQFYNTYQHAAGYEGDWFDRRRDAMKEEDELIVSYDELNRKEQQDFANCLHINTKLRLMGLPASRTPQPFSTLSNELKEQVYGLFCRACEIASQPNYPQPQADDEAALLLDTMSQTEHLRWMAAHEICGFTEGMTYGENKGKNNMKPWEQLLPKVQRYDLLVVLTTLAVQYEGVTDEYESRHRKA